MGPSMLFWLIASASAQPAPEAATAAPPTRVVAFKGRPGGQCPTVAARQGQCVDLVDFLDLDRAWSTAAPAKPGPFDRAVFRDVGVLYEHAFEDLAFRWTAGDVVQSLGFDGYTALPSPLEAWEHSDLRRKSYSLPRQELFLGVRDWYDPLRAPTDARAGVFFPHVRYIGPEGQDPPAPTTVLAGRFATRLGYDGRLHDYDLMDADPTTSGPFFEQLFPYTPRGDDQVYRDYERHPLMSFEFPQYQLEDLQGGDSIASIQRLFAENIAKDDYAAVTRSAAEKFRDFRNVVYVQTAQFALEEFTTNQMRVMTAMTAMATPPGALGSETGLARELVAAARGETDTNAEIAATFDQEEIVRASSSSELHLRYEILPREVIAPWVADLSARKALDDAFWENLRLRLKKEFKADLDVGHQEPGPVRALDPATRGAWLRDNLQPGVDRQDADTEFLRAALVQLVETASRPLDPRERSKTDALILVDQARQAIASTFAESEVAAPSDVVEAATAQWQAVLAMHGYPTEHIPQGLGAVDPVSVCTTLDGPAATDEPSFRKIAVDVLVAAAPDLTGDEVIWSSRGELPFVAVDDPTYTVPEVDRIVDLGDGRTLYRVRYQLWSGWHLFWSSVPAAPGSDLARLALRTGAICEDTILTSPRLVPTIVRAGLLSGNFRPSTPEKHGDSRRAGEARPGVEAPSDNDQFADAAERGEGDASAAAEKAAAAKEAAENLDLANVAKAKPGFTESAFTLVEEDLHWPAVYLGGIVREPLVGLAGDTGLLLMVADATAPSDRQALRDLVPRTPYTRTRDRLRQSDRFNKDERIPSDERHIRTAGWLWYFEPERQRPVQLSPAYRPKDSVMADARRPRWSRRSTVDFWLLGGVGLFPLRSVTYECASEGGGGGSVLPCVPGSTLSQGFGGDLAANVTAWMLDQPRLALDLGVELRLDVVTPGAAAIASDSSAGTTLAPSFAWGLRPQGGVIIGLHTAPRPGSLTRSNPVAPTWAAPKVDGSSRLGRVQWGLRSGLLIGPGFNGLEGTVVGEGWAAASARRKRSPSASFTPYRPSTLVGPYLRLQYGFPMIPADSAATGYLTLDESWTWLVGARTQLRLKKAAKPPGVGE